MKKQVKRKMSGRQAKRLNEVLSATPDARADLPGWKQANDWRLAGLYACVGHEGKTALLRSVSIEYGPGNAECVWHDMDGARVGAHCITRCYGPIPEDSQ